jgi:glutaredoxin
MTLYVTENCRTCSDIREALEATAIAHETVVVPEQGWSERVPQGTEPPVLVDDEKVIQGNEEVLAYIEHLRAFKEDWLKYQSDVCYAD